MVGAEIPRPPVHRITLVQLAASFLLVLFTWLAYDKVAAYSAMCGALIAIVAQAYFARRAFAHSGASSAREIARSGYAGEIGKFILSAAGFAAVFAVLRPINPAAVFTGYLLMIAIQIGASWRLMR